MRVTPRKHSASQLLRSSPGKPWPSKRAPGSIGGVVRADFSQHQVKLDRSIGRHI